MENTWHDKTLVPVGQTIAIRGLSFLAVPRWPSLADISRTGFRRRRPTFSYLAFSRLPASSSRDFCQRRIIGQVGEASLKHGFSTGNTNQSAVIPAGLPEESGPTWLQDPRVARVVGNALLYGETVRRLYQLRAWEVMPNHAHAIFQPHTPMPVIIRWLKGRTSRVAAPGRPSGKMSLSIIGSALGRNFRI